MTPLAHEIARLLATPAKDRILADEDGVFQLVLQAAQFDLTDVQSQIDPLTFGIAAHRDTEGVERLTFLPAPVTWIEWKDDGLLPNGKPVKGERRKYLPERTAFLLVQHKTEPRAFATTIVKFQGQVCGDGKFVSLPLYGSGRPINEIEVPIEDAREFAASPVKDDLPYIVFACLSIINSPKIVARREHQPHAGLTREINRAGIPYEPMPWHQILLQVRAPEDEHGPGMTFTGKRAKHFVRSHLRVRLGRLELVSPHWRGDPELGLVRSSYRIKAPMRVAA
ncbi:MAG: hypothetical protein AB7P02_15735 [Alphaproteobacteria bacterium]